MDNPFLSPGIRTRWAEDSARRRRRDRFKRKLKNLAIGTVVTIGLLVAVLFEAAMLQEGIRWLGEQEHAHVERVAQERVAKECGRAR